MLYNIKITLISSNNPAWHSSILTVDFLKTYDTKVSALSNKICDLHFKQFLPWFNICLEHFYSNLILKEVETKQDRKIHIFLGSVTDVTQTFHQILDYMVDNLNRWLLDNLVSTLFTDNYLSIATDTILSAKNENQVRYCINQLTLTTEENSLWGNSFTRVYGMPLCEFPAVVRLSYFLSYLKRKAKNLNISFYKYLNVEKTLEAVESEVLLGTKQMTWTLPLYLEFP